MTNQSGNLSPSQAQRPRIRWKYVWISIPAFFLLQVLAGVILGLVIGETGEDPAILTSPALMFIIMSLTFLAGGFVVARLSPGSTIREPAIGAGIGITAASLLRGNFLEGALLSWIVPYALALGGAKVGELLQESAARKSGVGVEPQRG